MEAGYFGAMSQREARMTAQLREAYDAYNRGEFDAIMEWIHPDVELCPAGGQPAIRGAESYRAWLAPDAFEYQLLEVLEMRVSGDKLLVHQRSTAKGAGSGIEMEFLSWSVFTIDEDERTTRVQIFLEHEEADALEAAGLSESV